MKIPILGLEIRKAAAVDRPPTSPQIRYNPPQGWMTPYFQNYVLRKVSGEFYEALREGIPFIDAGIRRRISLNGTIKIIGENQDIVSELEDFNRSVPVGDTQKGIHAFLENATNEMEEQGFSVSEFIATPDFKDVAGLRVADSKHVTYRRNNDGKAEPWYRYLAYTPLNVYSNPQTLVWNILNANYGQTAYLGGAFETKLNPSNLIYFSQNNENGDPYGVSTIRSLEFISKLMMTIENSALNVWERFGDPSYQVTLNTTARTDADKRQQILQQNFTASIQAKREGKSADFVSVIGKDDKLLIEVIGPEGKELQMEVPMSHCLEAIVAKFGIPAWMLGVNTKSVQGMAQLEVEMALQDAKLRQFAMIPEFVRLYSTFLLLRGRKWKTITTDPNKPGDWGFYFETPNIRDVMSMANARFLNAQAGMMESGQNTGVTATSLQVGHATFALPIRKMGRLLPQKTQKTQKKDRQCSCGKHALSNAERPHSSIVHRLSSIEATKELQRSVPWPKLDKIESDYEAELKYDWNALRQKVFKIAGLTDPAAAPPAASLASPAKKDFSVNPDGKPSSASQRLSGEIKAVFSFDDAQRKQIMDALKEYLGWYDLSNTDSSVTWYYAQAYSQGLILAAELVGKDKPLLDILKNHEIFDQLTSDGFDLVKNNATTAIKDQIIAAMEQGVTDGSNPRDVASELSGLFDAQNSDWERLARTEMSGAAERAKLDEWEARGVDVSNAVEVPVHPRCRCSTTVEDDGNGNFKAVFAPAPDACDWCLSLQDGN